MKPLKTEKPWSTYWKINKGKKPVEGSAICFSNLNGGVMPDAIRYALPFDKDLQPGVADFYLPFIHRIIKFEGQPKFRHRKFKDKVIVRLESKGLSYIQTIFFLSWFRYLHEIQEIPNELFKRKAEGDDDETLFRKFQEIHHEINAGKLKVGYGHGMSCHGLIYDYYGPKNPKPITIAKLRENMVKKISTVQGHFKE